MKTKKTEHGHKIEFLLEKQSSLSHDNRMISFYITIDNDFGINIPATGEITSIGAKQLIEAINVAISLSNVNEINK